MIVRKLERHRQAWPFLEKVDIDEVPDYYDIVKNPIDLETIREKVTGDRYATYQEFIDDVEQLFYNARLYNKADSIVGRCIGPMQKYSQDLVVRHLPQCVETSGGEERAGSDDACSMPSVLNGGDS
ncbi:hypothetical protein NP493_90g03004 [Ridgeia piscesae]|uniref:Bromo domain-containing protein n=1 Tax=Ridgeia piscesae TaxID=27915 RepID=A0AAD9P8F9_RIDPI|nr:hypothetical protein NP493_90g03004 [Ridgeia piscesae]